MLWKNDGVDSLVVRQRRYGMGQPRHGIEQEMAIMKPDETLEFASELEETRRKMDCRNKVRGEGGKDGEVAMLRKERRTGPRITSFARLLHLHPHTHHCFPYTYIASTHSLFPSSTSSLHPPPLSANPHVVLPCDDASWLPTGSRIPPKYPILQTLPTDPYTMPLLPTHSKTSNPGNSSETPSMSQFRVVQSRNDSMS